jgi:hypothetical protein
MPSVKRRASNILNEYGAAQSELIGKAVVLTDGKAGTVETGIIDTSKSIGTYASHSPTDDEAFTYNKRVSRLSPVQEQRMIAKAIERNVPRDKIARALDINVRSISRKVQLLDGICQEAIGLLKDKMCPMAVFDVLRKMNPIRQIEAAELLINANNFSVSYASAILTGTPQAQLVTPQTPKRLKGMTAEAISRMERELSRLQEAISSIQDSYGQDHLHLTVVKGYLRKLITNDRVARYLEQYQPELFTEFQKIAEMTSTLPSEAA